MSENIQVPQGWEVKKLGEVVEKSFYGTSLATNKIGKYPVLKMANLDNGKVILSNIEYIDLTEKEFQKLRLFKNDILFNRTNSEELVGKIAIFDLNIECLVASYIVVFRLNQNIVYPLFLNFLLNTNNYKNNIKQFIYKGVSQCNINQTILQKHLSVLLPPLEEQKKIAEILSLWDKAIEQTKELIAYKEKQKKGLMQALLTGKKRLNGYTDEWKTYQLGEVCSITTGRLDANAMEENGIYPFFTCAKEVYKINTFAFDSEALLISGNGANVGYIHYYNGKFNAYQRTYVLNNFNEYIIFLKYYLENYLHIRIEKEKKAGNTPYITLDTISKMNLYIPNNNTEQKAIADILSSADEEIELLNKQLELYTEQKKGLMQNLLTGKVRV